MTVSLNDRYFSFFCKHQIKDYSPDQVIFVPHASNHSKHISGGVFHSIPRDVSNDDEDFPDVCAIEFEPHKYEIENLSHEFFPVVLDECWPSNSLGHLIVFGCPTKFRGLSLDETQSKWSEITLTTVVVTGNHVDYSNARYLHEAKMERNNTFPVDGMSGGPVFHLGRDASGFFVGLAGMILRGSDTSDNFRFIDTRLLRKFAETSTSKRFRLLAAP